MVTARAGLAEFEHELIHARTSEGCASDIAAATIADVTAVYGLAVDEIARLLRNAQPRLGSGSRTG
jgi:hypothetical protein